MGLAFALAGNTGLAASQRDPFEDVAAAMRSGDLPRADRMLRKLADDDQLRLRAVQTLRRLHELNDYRLDVDQAAIDRTLNQVGTPMRRYETMHFVTLSDCDASWTRAKTALLERAHHQFFRFAEHFGLDVVPPEHKLLCVIFHDYDKYRRFSRDVDHVDAPWAGGYFATQSNRVVLFDDRQSPAIHDAMARLDQRKADAQERRQRAVEAASTSWAAMADALRVAADQLEAEVEASRTRILEHAERLATAKTIHEAVHMLSYNSDLQRLGQVYPFWVSEGLATAFESDDPSLPFGPRRPYAEREAGFDRVVSAGKMIPLERVVTVPAGLEGADQLGDPIYSESYELFTYLAQTSPDALRSYLTALRSLPSGTFDQDYERTLFEQHFGRIDAVERALVRGRGAVALSRNGQ